MNRGSLSDYCTLSFYALVMSITLWALPLFAAAQQEDAPEQKNELFQASFNDAPTYIRAGSLSLKSGERTFTYHRQVTVEQGDFTLTSDSLVGHYDEKNQIQDLVATGNVIIIRGDSVRATGERAEYLQATETITLTESPELQQDDSVLTADTIKIFLNEDRSTAEGNVRVKLVEDKEKKQGKKKSSGSFSLKKR